MENFNIDRTVDFSKPENQDRLIKEHAEFMENKRLKPIEQKLKEYEEKINSYQEQQLFSTIKDPKKIELVKNLMSTEKYKDLSKEESFKLINEDYKDFLIDKKPEINQPNQNEFNPKTLLDLHNNSTDLVDLKTKATTQGLTNEQEKIEYLEFVRNEALKTMNKK